MYNKFATTTLCTLLLAGALTGCNGSDDDDAAPRTLDVTSESVEQNSVVNYFSEDFYGPTLDIYHFAEQQSVLLVRITGIDTAADDMEAVLHVFAEDESEGAIEKWINNQHSDGLYPDAAEPMRDYTLPAESYRIDHAALIEQGLSPGDGQTYDHYQVTYTFDGESTDLFELNGFSHTTDFYEQTTDSSDQ